MKEGFERFIANKCSYPIDDIPPDYQPNGWDLIKAMWAINREGNKDWTSIKMRWDGFSVRIHDLFGKTFEYRNHNNSELEALTKALEYIYENTRN